MIQKKNITTKDINHVFTTPMFMTGGRMGYLNMTRDEITDLVGGLPETSDDCKAKYEWKIVVVDRNGGEHMFYVYDYKTPPHTDYNTFNRFHIGGNRAVLPWVKALFGEDKVTELLI